LLCRLYISLSVPRHKKMVWPGGQAHLPTAAAMAMVKRPAASRRPVAPPARSPKKSEASGNAPQTAAAPKNNATLRMGWALFAANPSPAFSAPGAARQNGTADVIPTRRGF